MSTTTLKKMGIIIGVRNAILALMTDDTSSATTYATLLRKLSGLIEIALTYTVTEEMLGADDVSIWDILSNLDSIEVSMTTAALGKDGESFMLGHQIDDNGVMVVGQSDKAPYLALGFESARSDGSIDYIWLRKGKFKPSDMTFRTKEKGKVNWQTPKLTATFIPRISDGSLLVKINDHDADADATALANFFASVYETGAFTYDVETTPITDVLPVAALPTTGIDNFAVYVLTAADGGKASGTMWRHLNTTWAQFGV